MNNEWIDVCVLVYVVGFIFFGRQSFQVFSGLQGMHKGKIPPVFNLRPDLVRYLILKPLFWPYYFFSEKSPVERLSETLFRHYGDKGRVYLGSQGLKNFLNDCLRGKKRYQHYELNSLCWPINRDSVYFAESLSVLGGAKEMHAHIIYGVYQNKYLLHFEINTELENDRRQKISPYVLDNCKRLNEAEFKAQLQQINYQKARDLL